MQKNRLFAAGLAAALLLGVATPAMAKQPNKGKAHAYGKNNTKPPKPTATSAKPAKKTKKTKAGVSGGGVVNGAGFSIQARLRDVGAGATSTSKGHFNYTATGTKIRCRGFDTFAVPSPAVGQSVPVTFNNCKVNDVAAGKIVVTVVDRGQPQAATAATAAVADWVGFSLTNAATAVATAYEGNLTDGNVKVR